MSQAKFKIYLITHTLPVGKYDCYESAVVVARSPQDAKTIHPGDGDWDGSTWALTPAGVEAEYIGVAGVKVERGVVNSSFNAA